MRALLIPLTSSLWCQLANNAVLADLAEAQKHTLYPQNTSVTGPDELSPSYITYNSSKIVPSSRTTTELSTIQPRGLNFNIPFWSARRPDSDDPRVARMQYECMERGRVINPGLTYTWTGSYCDEDGNVQINCRAIITPHHEPRTFIICSKDQQCLQTGNWLNYLGQKTTMATCIDRKKNYPMQKIKKFGSWKRGLICGSGSVQAESGTISAIVEMAVHVHRTPVPGSEYSDEIKARQVFFWDIRQYGINLIDEDFDVSRASVPIVITKNHPRLIKCCVTVPDYWQLRESEVMVNFTRGIEFHKVKAPRIELEKRTSKDLLLLGAQETSI